MSAQPVTAIATFRFAKLRDLVIEHENWKNPRTVTGLDGESIMDLGRDMKARGIQTPLMVQKIYKDKAKDPSKVINLVLAGQRRYLGAEEVFDQDHEIPVVDRSVEPIELTKEAADELMLDMLSEVSRREGLSAYELSEVAQHLRDRKRTLLEIGKAVDRDESWVSKILTARGKADPKLLHRWRKGEITEEQFKDLASIKDPEQQVAGATAAVKARESGDTAEARTLTKELAAQFKQQTSPAKKPAPKPVGTADGKADDPPRRLVVKPLVIDEMLAMADKRPPTSDYVKGVIDFARFAVGDIEMADFSKAWHAYVSRVSGTTKPKKSKKAKRKPAKKAKRK